MAAQIFTALIIFKYSAEVRLHSDFVIFTLIFRKRRQRNVVSSVRRAAQREQPQLRQEKIGFVCATREQPQLRLLEAKVIN